LNYFKKFWAQNLFENFVYLYDVFFLSKSAWRIKLDSNLPYTVPLDHLLLDRFSNIGQLMSRWELDKFKNCWNKSFRTSKILTLLYQQFSNLLIFQRDMSGPRSGALSNNRWLGGA
jgi:hypothetical protein